MHPVMKNSYPNSFKLIVLQHLERNGSIAETARRFCVHPSTVYAWKCIGVNEFLRRGQASMPIPAADIDQKLEERLHFLEKENAVLREAAKLYFNY